MSSPWIEGIPPRAERAAPRIDVLTPTFHYPVYATLLSARVWTRWKHYDVETKRPYPCSASSACPACQAGLIKYPTGWMACCSAQTYRPVIVQLSDLALSDLEKYAATAPILRGLQIKTTRQDCRRNAKMHAFIIGRDEREHIPAEFDLRPTLEAMWGCAEAQRINPEQVGRRDGRRDGPNARKGR